MVVDVLNHANAFVGGSINDAEAHQHGENRHFVLSSGEVAGEIDVASRQLAGSLLSVHITELDKGQVAVAKAVFLHKERYQDAVDLQYQILALHAVENVVVEMEGHLALHAVRLAQTPYLKYLFFLNHLLR